MIIRLASTFLEKLYFQNVFRPHSLRLIMPRSHYAREIRQNQLFKNDDVRKSRLFQFLVRRAFSNSAVFRFQGNFPLKCIWQTFFRICSIKSPQCTDKYSKKIFDSDFPFPCCVKFHFRLVQNRETKNRRLGTMVTSFQDSTPREKQVFPTVTYFLINNALLYHFLVNWLAHNKKTSETISDSAECYAGLSVRFESSAACM